MNLFAPASVPWFLRHELRVSWRWISGMAGGRGRSIIISFVIVGLTALALAWGLGTVLYHRGVKAPALVPLPGIAVLAIDSVMAFFGSLMVAQTLASATMIFYDRGDLDLLLSSPVRPWKILATRMLVMAFNSMLFFQILILPVVLTSAAVMGYWGLLAIPLVIALLSLAMTAVGMVLAMALFRLLGPRRTRSISQIIGVAVALGIIVTTRLLPVGKGNMAFGHITQYLHSAPWGPFAIWWANAATGNLAGLAILSGSAVGIFVLVTLLLGARFSADASLAAGTAEPVRKAGRATQKAAFKSGSMMRIMVIKELKLLIRDPTLISQVLLQVIYLPFVMFLSFSRGRAAGGFIAHLAPAFCAGAMAYVAGQLAAGLGWLTISAEEAPELLTCAPITPDQAARAKVTAVVLPVAVLLGVLSFGLAFLSPWAGFCAFVGACAGAAAIAYMELWMQRPGKRSAYRMRMRGTGSVGVSLLEALVSALFGVTTGMAAAGTVLAVIPALLLVALIATIASVNRDKWLIRNA